MAMDPIKDGENWYQYCGSNPLKYWDPMGLSDMAIVASSFSIYSCVSYVSTVGLSISPIGLAIIAAVGTALIIHEMGWDEDIVNSVVNFIKNDVSSLKKIVNNGALGGSPNGGDEDDPIKN